MKSFISHSFDLETPHSLGSLVDRLNTYIEPVKTLRWKFSRDHAPYQGTVSDQGFNITRIIHYRNSFLPRIRGQFESTPQGTIVKVNMALHPFVLAFLVVWILVWYSAVIPLNITQAMPSEIGVIFLLTPFFMLTAFAFAFRYEVNRSQKDLEQIIQSDTLQVEKYFKERQKKTRKLQAWQILLYVRSIIIAIWLITSGGF